MNKIQTFMEDAINKMFMISGSNLRYSDVHSSTDKWWWDNTTTEEQLATWRGWFLVEIKKRRIAINVKSANLEFDMFNLAYGLKIEKK
jgi:hypothetical protein